MARKLQQKLPKVCVYIRIRLTDGSQPYCPAIWESKKRLRPHWCLVCVANPSIILRASTMSATGCCPLSAHNPGHREKVG